MKSWILKHLSGYAMQFIEMFLQEAWVKLSKSSGRQGLSSGDFTATVHQVTRIQQEDVPGSGKSAMVSDWLIKQSGNKIAPWVAQLLTYLAYLYAEKKGLIK